MVVFEYFSDSPAVTSELGEKIGLYLRPGSLLALVGELGCGKTLFTRGICDALGVPPRMVNSPTFILANEYRGRLPVFHLDMYQLGAAADAVEFGFFDYLARAAAGVMIIEWAEKIAAVLPEDYINVKFTFLAANKRRLEFTAYGKEHTALLKELKLC